MSLNLLSDGLNGGLGAQEAVGKGLVFPQEAEQQVLSFNIRTAKLTRLVAGEEDDAPCLLCITLKHGFLAPL